MTACCRAAAGMSLCLGCVSVCSSQQSPQPASNSAIFPQVPVACAGRVLGADFCPNLEEPDQRLEVQVGVLLFYQSGVLWQYQGSLNAEQIHQMPSGSCWDWKRGWWSICAAKSPFQDKLSVIRDHSFAHSRSQDMVYILQWIKTWFLNAACLGWHKLPGVLWQVTQPN